MKWYHSDCTRWLTHSGLGAAEDEIIGSYLRALRQDIVGEVFCKCESNMWYADVTHIKCAVCGKRYRRDKYEGKKTKLVSRKIF